MYLPTSRITLTVVLLGVPPLEGPPLVELSEVMLGIQGYLDRVCACEGVYEG